MCKYCDSEEAEVFKVYNKENGIISKESNKICWICCYKGFCALNFEEDDYRITILDRNNLDNDDSDLEIQINYCPMCGKQLREKLID